MLGNKSAISSDETLIKSFGVLEMSYFSFSLSKAVCLSEMGNHSSSFRMNSATNKPFVKRNKACHANQKGDLVDAFVIMSNFRMSF